MGVLMVKVMKKNKSKKMKLAVSKKVKVKKSSKVTKNKFLGRLKKIKLKEKTMFEVPHYPQSEEFTSSAACAMMVLKYINPKFNFKKENEYSIWQEAVNGSVWHGSKYGVAYSISKRGAKVGIISNTKDEGYDKKIAVYENVNLDTLNSSFNEIKQKSQSMNIEEEHSDITLNSIKKALSENLIPIVLIDASQVNTYLEPSPHWVVVKGYDKDAFYINDPYSDSTITIDAEAFKGAIGFDENHNMILIDTKHFEEPKEK
jgi:uncharacterized protein YvpB